MSKNIQIELDEEEAKGVLKLVDDYIRETNAMINDWEARNGECPFYKKAIQMAIRVKMEIESKL